MSIIHVTQIASKISALFTEKIDNSDIKVGTPDGEINSLSRSLAAYAIYNHAACTPEEAAAAVVDGPDDNGIDAIFYSPTLKNLVIVQSKWIKSGSGEPESGEIAKFCRGVEDLLNADFDRFNEKVLRRQAEIEAAIASFDTRYVLILAYTGDKGIAEHGKRVIDDLVRKLNDAGEGTTEELVRFKKLDQAKIYTTLSKGLMSDPINLDIGLHQWGKYAEPYGAYYGYVSGEEIAKLWAENGRKLFHRNIRNMLGKTDVNEELANTIQNSPDKFWYFNNGITIISDLIEKSMIGGTNRDLGSFKLTNASIVNGAQTLSTVGESADKFPEQIKKLYILVRCISLQSTPEEFGNEVTRANNRQNRIENRDFVSQDSEQHRLREELAHDNINYNIARSDLFAKSHTAIDVEEATLSLACASGLVSLAVQSKRELGKFYEDLTKGIYKQIFNPHTSGRYLNNCVQINREIERIIAQKINTLGKKSGKEYGILVHGNRMLSMLICKRLPISRNEVMKMDDINIAALVDTILPKMAAAITTNFSDNFLATLFKNKSKCDQLEAIINEKQE